ncbi:MAG: apolipoprotein N-acyltransferase [Bacteroidetes bacterium]|nr:MAG: apolipoprotein N-acyltransferase [Bacteroidota bacterium]
MQSIKDFLKNLSKNRFYLLILSLSSGFLLTISWYFYFQFLIFIALVPILAIEKYAYEQKLKNKILYGYVYLAFLIWNIGTTYWVANASLGGGLFAFFANSALQALPVLFFHMTKKNTNNRFGYFALFTFFLAFEYLHFNWTLSWSWLTLGNVFAQVPNWVQWYEYTGSLGGSLWIWMVNVACFYTLFHTHTLLLWALSILIPIAFSYKIYFSLEETGKKVEVVIVQPNFDCYEEKFDYNARTGERNNPKYVPYEQQVKRFLDLSKTQVTDKTQFLVFPETSLHETILESTADSNLVVKTMKNFTQNYANLCLLSGCDSYKIYENESQAKQESNTFRNQNGMIYDVFNAAIFLGKDVKTEFYHKSKLVMGVEMNPLGFLKFIDEWIKIDLGGVTGNLGTQKERTIFFNSQKIGVAPVVCYESLLGEYMADYVKKGAEIVFIITNDGWWDDTAGYRQHWAYARLRAIELRRAVAQAANTGISGFIDQKGKILSKSDYDQPLAMKHELYTNKKLTFYAKHGDYLGRLSAFLCGFMMISGLVKRKIKS